MKKIYTTSKYDMFKTMIENRDVKTRTTNKIIDSINAVGYITNPIIVNERMEVIDGQNRLEALKKLGMPVDYIIVEGARIEHCRALNINQSNWTTMDWIRSYASGGDINYKYLYELLKAYPDMKLSVIAFAITGLVGAVSKSIPQGTFHCSEKDYNDAMQALDYLRPLLDVIRRIDGKQNLVECAVIWCYKDGEVDNGMLVDKLTKYASMVEPVSNLEQALEQVEKVYNYKNRYRVYIKTNYLKSRDRDRLMSSARINARKDPQRSIR